MKAKSPHAKSALIWKPWKDLLAAAILDLINCPVQSWSHHLSFLFFSSLTLTYIPSSDHLPFSIWSQSIPCRMEKTLFFTPPFLFFPQFVTATISPCVPGRPLQTKGIVYMPKNNGTTGHTIWEQSNFVTTYPWRKSERWGRVGTVRASRSVRVILSQCPSHKRTGHHTSWVLAMIAFQVFVNNICHQC